MQALWQINFERALEDFAADRETIGDANAIEIARTRLEGLGLDRAEINFHIAEALS